MTAFAVDFNEILAATDVVDQVLVGIQLVAQLIGVGDLQLAAELY